MSAILLRVILLPVFQPMHCFTIIWRQFCSATSQGKISTHHIERRFRLFPVRFVFLSSTPPLQNLSISPVFIILLYYEIPGRQYSRLRVFPNIGSGSRRSVHDLNLERMKHTISVYVCCWDGRFARQKSMYCFLGHISLPGLCLVRVCVLHVYINR